MSKSILFKVLIGLSWLVAAVLWLLSITLPETFGFFTLNWAVVIIAGTAGIAYLVRGIISKKSTVLKKVDIIVATALILITVLSVVFALALPKSYVWPIIAIVLTAGGLISVLAVGGKKWDEGDNHKVGYKDYRARKAEEQRNKPEFDFEEEE